MTARLGAERGIPAASSQQMLDRDSYVSQAFPIRKCPEGCVKRGKAPHFRMAVKLARMSHLSYAEPRHPLTCLISANKKIPYPVGIHRYRPAG